MSDFECVFDKDGRQILVSINGDLTHKNRHELLQLVEEMIEMQRHHFDHGWSIVIDLSQVGIIDGSGFGALAFLVRVAEKNKCQLSGHGVQRVPRETAVLLPPAIGESVSSAQA